MTQAPTTGSRDFDAIMRDGKELCQRRDAQPNASRRRRMMRRPQFSDHPEYIGE
jgi:hypothetical protein